MKTQYLAAAKNTCACSHSLYQRHTKVCLYTRSVHGVARPPCMARAGGGHSLSTIFTCQNPIQLAHVAPPSKTLIYGHHGAVQPYSPNTAITMCVRRSSKHDHYPLPILPLPLPSALSRPCPPACVAHLNTEPHLNWLTVNSPVNVVTPAQL